MEIEKLREILNETIKELKFNYKSKNYILLRIMEDVLFYSNNMRDGEKIYDYELLFFDIMREYLKFISLKSFKKFEIYNYIKKYNEYIKFRKGILDLMIDDDIVYYKMRENLDDDFNDSLILHWYHDAIFHHKSFKKNYIFE